MRRNEIDANLTEAVKTKSWIVRKLWPLVKDFIIDMVFKFLEDQRNNNNKNNAKSEGYQQP